MTVKELIEKLKGFDDDAVVYIHNHDTYADEPILEVIDISHGRIGAKLIVVMEDESD